MKDESRSRIRPIPVMAAAALVAVAVLAPAASAQYPTGRVLPAGVVRIGFEPSYTTSDRRFDLDGEQEPLGTDLSSDSAGLNLFPTLAAPQSAVRTILLDPTYEMNIGAVMTDLEADVRVFPFNLQFGFSNRLTLVASLPFMTTRTQVALTLDSTGSNVGWNQSASASGNATGLSETVQLLNELTDSRAMLDALVTSGAFDCPSGPTCEVARGLVARTATLRDQIALLTGVDVGGNLSTELPPFAPLANSAAGQALLAAIQGIAQELTNFGVPQVATTLPLPTTFLTADDLNTVLTTAGFGYDAQPLEFVKLQQRMGDAELGLRWGLVQRPSVRATLSTTVRLPTGIRDQPGNFVDIGTGDKQTDVIGGVELVFEPGSVVSLALGADYTLQVKDQLPRRIAPPDRPLAPAATEFTVSRDLGDILRLRAFPALRLHPNLRAFVSVDYLHKQSDVFTIAQTSNGGGDPPNVTDLELETGIRRLSVGGGLHYRSLSGTGRLPVEAGLHYQTAFQGSGGLTPLTTSMSFYLRLFYRLFGGGEPEQAPADTLGTN